MNGTFAKECSQDNLVEICPSDKAEFVLLRVEDYRELEKALSTLKELERTVTETTQQLNYLRQSILLGQALK